MDKTLEITEELTKPKRYTQNAIECWDFVAQHYLHYYIATAIKYIYRYQYKHGLEDLKKAHVFLEKAYKESELVAELYGGTNTSLEVDNIKRYQNINQADFPDMNDLQFTLIKESILTVTGSPETVRNQVQKMLDVLDKLTDLFLEEHQSTQTN